MRPKILNVSHETATKTRGNFRAYLMVESRWATRRSRFLLGCVGAGVAPRLATGDPGS